MGEPDELFSCRNYFYLGNYTMCTKEGMNARVGFNKDLDTERKAFLHRAAIAQGNYAMVVSEVGPDAPTPLQAVKMLALYQQACAAGGGEEQKALVVTQVQQFLGESSDATLQIVAAMIFMHEEDYGEALKVLQPRTSLEMHSLIVQTYLRMSRMDKAQEEWVAMKEIDEDATLTQLTLAFIDLALGPSKFDEALTIFEDFADKYDHTGLLLNATAVAHIQQKDYDTAETQLMEAVGKNSSDVDAMVNLIVCSQLMGKPADVVARYVAQLKASAPHCKWLAKQASAESAFDREAGKFTIG